MKRSRIREVTGTARQFLDGPAPDGPFRVYHQSFADFLVDPEQNPDFLIDAAEAHEAIVAAYAATDPLSWDDYARRNLALHASKVGQLDHLLEDARFLLAADPARLVPHLAAARSTLARASAAVYRAAAHYLAQLGLPMRASQLELLAHRLGHRTLAARIAEAAPDRPWQTRWSQGRRTISHQILSDRAGGAVALGSLPDGTPVIVSGGDTVRIRRLAHGTLVGEPLRGQVGRVRAVAVGHLPDGPLIVSGGDTVQVWRLADGTPVGEPLTGHYTRLNALATGALPDGTPVIVTADRDSGQIWRLADGTPLVPPLDLSAPVRAIAVHGDIIVTAAGADIAVH